MTMSVTGVGPARLAHFDRLAREYPALPKEVLLKEDVLTEGVAPAPGVSLPDIGAIQGGPLGLRRVIVRLRPTLDSPYRVRIGTDGLVLADAETDQELGSLRAYPWRPEYEAKVLPSGVRAAAVMDPLGIVRLSRASPPSPEDVAEAAAETFALSTWHTGETPLAIRLTPDLEVQRLPDAEQDALVLPYVRALQARLGNVRPILLVGPPRPAEAEQRLLEAGVTGRISSLEVWDLDAFDRIGPKFDVTRDQWIERLIGQSHIYLSSYAQPALLVGKEMSRAGGLDLDAALASNKTAVRFFQQHRVLVRLAHWSPPAGADGSELRPPVQYFLELDQYWYEQWRAEYGVEFGADSAGPGASRDPDGACWDVGRGASLTPGRP